jgi:hypothetical protein
MIAIAASFMPGLAVIFTAGDGIRYAAMRPVILDEKHSGRHSGWKFDPLCGLFPLFGIALKYKTRRNGGSKISHFFNSHFFNSHFFNSHFFNSHFCLYTRRASEPAHCGCSPTNPANVVGLYCSKPCQAD